MTRAKRTERPANTAGMLLAAAEREFAEKGFAAARLEDIAQRVGLTRPSLLHHFQTKEQLYGAVVEGVFQRLRQALLDGMGSEGTFADRVSATVGHFVDHLHADPIPAMLVVRELQDAKGPGERLMREQVSPLLDLVEAFVRQAGKEHVSPGLDVRAAILDFVGAVILYGVSAPVRSALYGTNGKRDSWKALRAHFVQLAHHLLFGAWPRPRPAEVKR